MVSLKFISWRLLLLKPQESKITFLKEIFWRLFCDDYKIFSWITCNLTIFLTLFLFSIPHVLDLIGSTKKNVRSSVIMHQDAIKREWNLLRLTIERHREWNEAFGRARSPSIASWPSTKSFCLRPHCYWTWITTSVFFSAARAPKPNNKQESVDVWTD